MKTTKKLFIQLLLMMTTFSACKKDSVEPGNQGTLPAISSSDFIEFKIDGAGFKINCGDSPMNIAMAHTSDSMYLASLNLTYYQTELVYMSAIPGSSITNVYVVIGSRQRNVIGNYNHNFTSTVDVFGVQIMKAGTNEFYDGDGSTSGLLNITHDDGNSGGKITGTFNLSNMVLYDSGGNQISRNHILTDGKFSITIP